MKDSKNKVKQETLLIAVFISLVIGFILGVFFAVYKLDSSSGAPQTTTDTSQAHDHGDMSQEQVQLLHTLKATLKADPKNIKAWIQLGHLYFDAGDAGKAISAYSESLKLHEGDANLFTDLGVMYRRTKQFEKAIEVFDKASSMDPSHEPSRLNKGIVLMFDLGKDEEAIKTWEALLTVNPNAKTANGGSVADFLAQVKKDLATQKSTEK